MFIPVREITAYKTVGIEFIKKNETKKAARALFKCKTGSSVSLRYCSV